MRFLRWLFYNWDGGYWLGVITMLIITTLFYGFINSGQQEIIDDVIAQRDSCYNKDHSLRFEPMRDSLIGGSLYPDSND